MFVFYDKNYDIYNHYDDIVLKINIYYSFIC